jgi:hypothetical protein
MQITVNLILNGKISFKRDFLIFYLSTLAILLSQKLTKRGDMNCLLVHVEFDCVKHWQLEGRASHAQEKNLGH